MSSINGGLLYSLPLHLQQRFLALHSPAIAADVAIFTHHAMAWNCYCNRIGGTGTRHGAAGAGLADRLRSLTIRARRAKRDRLQIHPPPPLKSRGANIQR